MFTIKTFAKILGNVTFAMIGVGGGTFFMGATPGQGIEADDDAPGLRGDFLGFRLALHFGGELRKSSSFGKKVLPL